MSAELDLISEQDATIERLSAELDSIMGKWEAAKRVAEFFSEECKTHKARADKAEAALAKVREAAKPIIHYVDMRQKKPLRSMGDFIHCIHTNTEWEAELRLSDLEFLRASLTEGEVRP